MELKPCTFTYNKKKYGGIQYFRDNAESGEVVFEGESNFKIFGMDYFDIEKHAPINSEIMDSLNFDSSDILEYKSTYKFQQNTIYHEGNSYPVVEKGNNANGYYLKYVDGTLICYGNKTVSLNINSADNYNVDIKQKIIYPSTFQNVPATTIQMNVSEYIGAGISTGTNSVATLTLYFRNNDLDGAKRTIFYSAIGRWK